jgi:glycosyltransferase involved in cell wall biosynthesis
MTRVAVIVPCFNDGATLEDAVRSVVLQRHDTELIVVDDGSTDRATHAAYQRLRSAGIRILYRQHAGTAEARTAGLHAATAPYVLPLDADDRLAPDSLTVAATYLDGHPHLAAAWGDYRLFGSVRRVQQTAPALDPWHITYQNDLPVTALFRRDAVLAAGGWTARRYEDWDLWMSLAENGFDGRRLDLVLYERRVHGRRKMALDVLQHEHALSEQRERHPRLFNARRRNWRRSEVPVSLRVVLPALERLPLPVQGRRIAAGTACHLAYRRGIRNLLSRWGE